MTAQTTTTQNSITLEAGSEVDIYVSNPAGGNEIERPDTVDALLSAPILAALERAWGAIRHRHPDLPMVVMVLASGSDGAPAGWLKLGHFAAMRWETHHDVMPEVFIGGEGLARGATSVLATLLHEAGHALAHVRGIKDTSRQGRYHNARYADLARTLGLDVAQIAPIGWSNTSITEATQAEYTTTLADLTTALTISRRSESDLFGTGTTGEDPDSSDGDGGDTRRAPRRARRGGTGPRCCGRPSTPTHPTTNGVVALCSCTRRIRITRSVLDAGPITCGICNEPFAVL